MTISLTEWAICVFIVLLPILVAPAVKGLMPARRHDHVTQTVQIAIVAVIASGCWTGVLVWLMMRTR